MESAGIWITPLVLLPGVALLIMSTSVRYGQIHSEFHHLENANVEVDDKIFGHLKLRCLLFRNALVSLYVSVALFALASLLGGITLAWMDLSYRIIFGLTGVGIASLLYAASQLIRESVLSYEIIKTHEDRYQKRLTKK